MVKVYKKGNYLVLLPDGQTETIEYHAKNIRITTGNNGRYYFRNGFDLIYDSVLPSDIVDENGDAYADFDTWRTENTGFSTATGGSVADKTERVLIDEAFTTGYDTSRFQITNGTMSIVGGKLRVVCSQSTTSGNLSNGLKNAAITAISINPTVWKHTALLNHETDATYEIVTTSANRQYVGFGIKGTGEKTPQNGGVMVCHSSTSADNTWIVNDQENARLAVGQILTVGTKVRIVSKVLNNFFDAKIYVNDVLVKVNKYSGLCENDLQGRFGLFSLFGWGCTFDVLSYKVTDLDYNTYDIAVVGDSIVQNWGVHSYSGIDNWANRLKNESNKAVKLFAKSSQTIQDCYSNTTEVLNGSPTTILFEIGTNAVLLNKTLSAIQTDFTTLMSAYTSAGYTGNRYICTIPPIIGNATQNTRANDFNAWLRTTYGTATGYKVVDFWQQLITPSTTAFDPLKANDNYHPNIYGHEAMSDYLLTNFSELY
jgi:lysophospholipase L1-like esterase